MEAQVLALYLLYTEVYNKYRKYQRINVSMWQQAEAIWVCWSTLLLKSWTLDTKYSAIVHQLLKEVPSENRHIQNVQKLIDIKRNEQLLLSCSSVCVSAYANLLSVTHSQNDRPLFTASPWANCRHMSLTSDVDSAAKKNDLTPLNASIIGYRNKQNLGKNIDLKSNSKFLNPIEIISELGRTSSQVIDKMKLPSFFGCPRSFEGNKSVYFNFNNILAATENVRVVIYTTIRSAYCKAMISRLKHSLNQEAIIAPLDKSYGTLIAFFLRFGKEKHYVLPKPVLVAHTQISSENEKTDSSSSLLFKVVPVTVIGPTGNTNVYALLDDGASETLIDQAVAEYVGAKGPIKRITILGIGGMGKVKDIQLVDVGIKGIFTNRTFLLKSVISVHKLNVKKQVVRFRDLVQFPHLEDIAEMLSYKECAPALIIGIDNYHLLLPRDLRIGYKNEPAAIRTALGWAVFGKVSGKDFDNNDKRSIYSASSRQMWNGIVSPSKKNAESSELLSKHFSKKENNEKRKEFSPKDFGRKIFSKVSSEETGTRIFSKISKVNPENLEKRLFSKLSNIYPKGAGKNIFSKTSSENDGTRFISNVFPIEVGRKLSSNDSSEQTGTIKSSTVSFTETEKQSFSKMLSKDDKKIIISKDFPKGHQFIASEKLPVVIDKKIIDLVHTKYSYLKDIFLNVFFGKQFKKK